MIRVENQTDIIRKNLAHALLSRFFDGTLAQTIDILPVELYPKNRENIRCCVHKERAVTRYRILALLGADVEADDDIRPLSGYLEDARTREHAPEEPLTMVQDACRSCVSGRYLVTEMCQGCVAQYCRSNCHKDAIVMENGRARIVQEACVNCGKCRTVCPYNAVSYLPVPCEEACPVKAVRKDANGIAHIDRERCIACGACMKGCPFGAVEIRSEIIDVAVRLEDPSVHTSALIAPSIAGQFPGSVRQIIGALYAAGFDSVYEVSAGAELTARHEARELLDRMESGEPLATSCCPAYVDAVRKHVPEFIHCLSQTPTPVSYSARAARSERPQTVTVFIGPCIAKKREGRADPHIDYVLTFDEIGAMLLARKIDVFDCAEADSSPMEDSSMARNFAVSGGVSAAVLARFEGDAESVKTTCVNGLDRKALALLGQIAKGSVPGGLVEVMSCEGGCICGPGSTVNPRIAVRKHREYADECRTEEKSAAR